MPSNRNWTLKIRTKVICGVVRFPKKDRDRIAVVIETLPDDPLAGDIEKMAGEENTWRRRVGSYRIFYELRLDERVVYVYRVERRTSKTY